MNPGWTLDRICGGFVVALSLLCAGGAVAGGKEEVSKLERSYWLQASLSFSGRGYWNSDLPEVRKPADSEIRNAARLLTGKYAANRLYLMYHNEMPIEEAESMFERWRKLCPKEVEIVPTLVLRQFNKERTLCFSVEELKRLSAFFKHKVNPKHIGTYDVEIRLDQGPGLALLAEQFPGALIRVGIQPSEPIGPGYEYVVQDTWTGFCLGKSNQDWQKPGFGAEILRQWVEQRNSGKHPVAWDLIVVAWDYTPNEQGTYPGYDDSKKNMPLPVGRNRLAAEMIRKTAKPELFKGFSSDLFILEVNSKPMEHDGAEGAFYNTLKRGKVYEGYYAEPFREMVEIYQKAREGRTAPSSGR